MTREQINEQVKRLAKVVEKATGAQDLTISLCKDGILVDHIGNKNEKVMAYFKTMRMGHFEYDELCDCSYYEFYEN